MQFLPLWAVGNRQHRTQILIVREKHHRLWFAQQSLIEPYGAVADRQYKRRRHPSPERQVVGRPRQMLEPAVAHWLLGEDAEHSAERPAQVEGRFVNPPPPIAANDHPRLMRGEQLAQECFDRHRLRPPVCIGPVSGCIPVCAVVGELRGFYVSGVEFDLVQLVHRRRQFGHKRRDIAGDEQDNRPAHRLWVKRASVAAISASKAASVGGRQPSAHRRVVSTSKGRRKASARSPTVSVTSQPNC